MPKKPFTLQEAVRALRRLYGPPAAPPTRNPFELVLWENVAYLPKPGQRSAAFAMLEKTVGLSPPAILRAKRDLLEAVAAHGILKAKFADKLRECAQIAIDAYGGDLGGALKGSLTAAKKALRKFPGIGEPGAEKILLFAGLEPFLAPDSNALRVLARLGFIKEEKSYARTYANARSAAAQLRSTISSLKEAHLLLQQHGQTLCRLSAPRCEECPLVNRCPWASAHRTIPNTLSR
ncbi:MAG TPA: hypothetical protein VGI92_03165 [Gemmatimonadales bacterium]